MLLFSMVENEKDLSKFQRIYDQYKNMMYWVAYDITKNTHDAEDVVQLSLIKLIDILYRIEESYKDYAKVKLNVNGDETTGKWDETENGISIEDEMEFQKLDDNTLTYEVSGVTVHFARD